MTFLRVRPVLVPIVQRPAFVGVGAEMVRTEVGASSAVTLAGGIVWIAAAAVEGAFAYALLTGKYIFETKHPVWGTIFALLAMSNLYAGGATLMKAGEQS